MKRFKVTYKSRYYPFEGTRYLHVTASTSSWIRANWHSIINTDEYKITKIEEVKEDTK